MNLTYFCYYHRENIIENWSEAVDMGKKYWYNKVTYKTCFEDPNIKIQEILKNGIPVPAEFVEASR
jgi:hypothetical protein